MKRLIRRYPLLASILCTIVAGIIIFLVDAVIHDTNTRMNSAVDYFGSVAMASLLYSVCIFYPFVLLAMEIFFFVRTLIHQNSQCAWKFDQTALWYGMIMEAAYLSIDGVTWSDWMVQLTNDARHTPIYSGSWLTIAIIAVLAIIGYDYLSFRPMSTMPPLMAVLSISAMYLGIVELILFTIQVCNLSDPLDFLLLLWPACIVLMSGRTILAKIREWKALPMEKMKIHQNRFLNAFDHLLSRSSLWPIWGLVLTLPLLGILIAILMLFGQTPDAAIKAWTETADWKLSAKEAPQNIYYDEHYLCTVAAGGHRKIVKPIRKGIRHGHPVIVNRQLCIANAFEQVLEERTPHLHKTLRSFYDHYGFPIARLIRRQWIADLVYFFMKPLEWIFLIVLYLTDVHPENRITVQYMGDIHRLQQ